MATVTRGYTFGSTEQVTAAKLHTLVDSATLSALVNGDIDAAAAIAFSKISSAGKIVNADINSSAAIAYSKLALTGAVLNADLAGSIADSKLSQITTASKVSGAAITGLASVPSGAGVLPIANIATGTPTGSKFVRDDGTLQVASFPDYAAGDNLIVSSDASTTSTSATPEKKKEIYLIRNGTLRIKFTIDASSVDTGAQGRIYRNGVAVGTLRSWSGGGVDQVFSEDISGWSIGDLCQLYIDNVGSSTVKVKNFRIYASIFTVESVVLA